MSDIVLTTINAKWIHPSLALRLLKANLGSLEDSCEIIEFALRQPLCEKLAPLIAALTPNGRPRILGISVSIWNHLATIELLEELEKTWTEQTDNKPIIILGGPEISHLPPEAEIFRLADYVICGEGETAFRLLCEDILQSENKISRARAQSPVSSGRSWPLFTHALAWLHRRSTPYVADRALRTRTGDFIFNELDCFRMPGDLSGIKSAYHLYTDEDLAKKLVYVEASRGCLFNCEFCLSSISGNVVREFPLEPFLSEMDKLIQRGAKTFKFLDRSININIPRVIQICEFFLERINNSHGIVVHFEMVPFLFPPELYEILARFPSGTLRLEIGIQTLNTEVAARIGRASNPEKELEALRLLREKTNAIIHADLIAGLPGEDFESFGRGFDRLWRALFNVRTSREKHHGTEIQLGMLKLLPGAPISRYNEAFGMRYSPLPPYEIEETASISADDLRRIKNFARFWEIIVNRGLITLENGPVFEKFMAFSDKLFVHFGRNWGIDKGKLLEAARQTHEYKIFTTNHTN